MIHFWTFVVWNGLGYHQSDGMFAVNESLAADASSSSACSLDDSAAYIVPLAVLKVYHPRGFEVSIPAEKGISLFAFHGKLNTEFDGRESGSWSRDILRVRNGRLTFRDCDTKLKVSIFNSLPCRIYCIFLLLKFRAVI